MNTFIALHHYLPRTKTTLTYQCHLTATSLILPGQGPWVFWPILVFLWVLAQNQLVYGTSCSNTFCHNCCEAGNNKYYDYFLNQHIFTQKATNSHYTHEFYPLVPPHSPGRLPCNVCPLLLPLPLPLPLLLTKNTQRMHNENIPLLSHIHMIANHMLVSQITLLTY